MIQVQRINPFCHGVVLFIVLLSGITAIPGIDRALTRADKERRAEIEHEQMLDGLSRLQEFEGRNIKRRGRIADLAIENDLAEASTIKITGYVCDAENPPTNYGFIPKQHIDIKGTDSVKVLDENSRVIGSIAPTGAFSFNECRSKRGTV